MPEEYQVIARKYRPQKFSEVIGQETITTTLKNAIHLNRLAHAYLFSGPHGTGKTSLARLFAKALNCENRAENGDPCGSCSSCKDIAASHSLQVLEIDGASNRGIDDIRQLNETIGFALPHNQYKIYIIDEVHMLTKEAFNALLKTLEEPPLRVKFFFATTEPHRVPATILSRCQRYDLSRIPSEKIKRSLLAILKSLEIQSDEEACHLIASAANGSMRDAQSLLDQVIAFGDGNFSVESAHAVLGLIAKQHFLDFDKRAKTGDIKAAIDLVEYVFTKGMNFSYFLQSLAEHFRALLLIKILGHNTSPLFIPESQWEPMLQSASYYTKEQCLNIIEKILQSETRLKTALSKRLSLEWLLIDIVRSHNTTSILHIIKRLENLEKKVEPLETPSSTIQVTPSPIITDTTPTIEQPKNSEKKRINRYDTVMQFAAIELEGTLTKK